MNLRWIEARRSRVRMLEDRVLPLPGAGASHQAEVDALAAGGGSPTAGSRRARRHASVDVGPITSPRRYNREFRERLPLLPWIRSVYLVAEPNPCWWCANAAGVYDAKALPMTPIQGCIKKRGCGCWLVALPSGTHASPATAETQPASADRGRAQRP